MDPPTRLTIERSWFFDQLAEGRHERCHLELGVDGPKAIPESADGPILFTANFLGAAAQSG